jgi:GT2 family glycosyltransferase
MLKLTVNLDDLTVVIPHHNRVDKLKLLMDDLSKIKNLVIRRGGTFARNNNKGFEVVETPYVLFLNDDSRVNNNLLRGMMRMMDHYDVVGVKTSEGCTGFNIINGVLEQVNDSTKDFHYPSGACLMIKTDVFRELLFDENFRNGCEDIDLYLRAEDKGYKIGIYTTQALQHNEGSSEGRYTYVNENVLLFNKLWKNRCQIKQST